MSRLLLLLLPLLIGCAPAPPAEPQPAPRPSVEPALRGAAAGGEIPPDFSVTYSDEHGMWGGTRVTLAASGAYEYRYHRPETGESRRAEGTVAPAEIRGVIALLVELQAWRQETEPRPAVPDESAAGVRIHAGGAESRMWEWYNEMASRNRLTRIRARLSDLQHGLRPAGGPGR